MKPLAQALTLAALWGGLLVLLAVLWIQSPFTGSGSMFFWWTLPALALLTGTWSWLGAMEIRDVPRGPKLTATLGVIWVATALVVLWGVGPELALDGLILRDPIRRSMGIGLRWLPVIFAAAVSTAGLAAALEARYRILHGESGRGPAEGGPAG